MERTQENLQSQQKTNSLVVIVLALLAGIGIHTLLITTRTIGGICGL